MFYSMASNHVSTKIQCRLYTVSLLVETWLLAMFPQRCFVVIRGKKEATAQNKDAFWMTKTAKAQQLRILCASENGEFRIRHVFSHY